MGDGTQEPAHAGFPTDHVAEHWQGYMNGRRFVAHLQVRECRPGDPKTTFECISAFRPGNGDQGVKTTLLPHQRSADDAMRHGRTCLLIMGFEPI